MDPVKPRPDRVNSVVPTWIRGSTNLLAMVVTAVLVGLLVVLIGWLSPVLAPLGLGMFLAALAAPLFSRLAERGYSPPVALTVTIGVLVLIIGGIVLLAITSARTLTEGLAGYSDALEARLAAPEGGLAIRDVLPPGLMVDVLQVAIDVVTQVGGTLLFALVVAALLLLDAPRLTRLVSGGLGSANPVFRQAPVIASAAVTYFVVRIRVNALTAISLFLLMVVVGVDHAPLWAVGAFFLSFVPYLGLILALIPPAILAFAESGPAAAAVIVIGGTVLNLVAENVLEPTLTGRALSLATWLVFVMFFFWVWLMGPIGALLSMPITVLLVLVLRHNTRTRWIAELLTRGGEQTAGPERHAGRTAQEPTAAADEPQA
jgi:predicted PurR-regulated permease PerM